MARRVVRLPGLDRAEVTALNATRESITFAKSHETDFDYPFSFFFDASRGHVILSGVRSETKDAYTYEVDRWVSGEPASSMRGYVNGWLASSPSDFDLDSHEVTLQSGKYELPATQAKKSDDWVILVHGRTARRAETFRAYQIFVSLGYSCLAISLRNNHEGTTDQPAISHFGLVEADDLEAAVSYVRSKGARRVIVYAISMGATVTSEYLRTGGTLDAVILDSPAVDWPATLKQQARLVSAPAAAVDAGIRIIKSRLLSRLISLSVPVDLAAIGFANWDEAFEIPILLMHSRADDYVPFAPAERLASAHRNVTLKIFENAGHVQLFNADPKRYQEALTTFLASVPK